MSTIFLVSILQVILALGLINVWLVRFRKSTPYRGKGAATMEAEFHAYGLATWFMYLIGVTKIAVAIVLIVGLWVPEFVYPAALVLCFLMLGAVSMHIKVKDSFKRTMPALLMLTMSVLVVLLV
jgi:uncharacterized membrane protein YkgB